MSRVDHVGRSHLGRSRSTIRLVLALFIGLFASALAVSVGSLADALSVRQTDEAANQLISSDPADGATLASSPEELRFVFAERLGTDDALTAPLSCGNQPQSTGIPDIASDRAVVTVSLPEPLPRGTCAVSWALRDGLGELITSGVFTFNVEADSTGAADDTAGATVTTIARTDGATAVDEGSTGSAGALWFGRFVSTMAILALFGAVVMIGIAWPEGPEYVITVRFVRSIWAVGMVGTVLFVVALTATSTGRSFAAALSPTQWVELLDAGWAGRAALARLVLLIACIWVVIRPERVIDPTSQLLAYALPALAVVTVGLSRVGGTFAVGGIVLAVLHALAAGLWFGGALMVARVVVAGPGDEDLVHAVRGFSRISTPAILVTVITGVLQMFRIVGGGLFTSSHGRVLLLKTVAVAAMVFVAVAARQVVTQRLARSDQLSAASASRFRRAFGVEAGIGAVVLALSSWLLALGPAGIDDRPSYEIERRFTDPVSGLDMTVYLTPSQTGLNGLRVEVDAPADGIANLNIAFLPPEGIPARGIDQPIPLIGAGTAILDTADGLPFDVPGQWTMQVSGITQAGSLAGATTSFEVGGDAIVVESSLVPDETGTTGSTESAGPSVVIEIIEE